MLIKLTNGAEGFEGQALAINTDVVLSVFETVNESGKKETFVFAGQVATWKVQESVEEIVKLFNHKA
jgi:hypothetical protein